MPSLLNHGDNLKAKDKKKFKLNKYPLADLFASFAPIFSIFPRISLKCLLPLNRKVVLTLHHIVDVSCFQRSLAKMILATSSSVNLNLNHCNVGANGPSSSIRTLVARLLFSRNLSSQLYGLHSAE